MERVNHTNAELDTAFGRLKVCTEYEWEQVRKGINIEIVGPYLQQNYVHGLDVVVEFWDISNENNPKLEAAMWVVESNTDKIGFTCTRMYAATPQVLNTVERLYQPTEAEWDVFGEILTHEDRQQWLDDMKTR